MRTRDFLLQSAAALADARHQIPPIEALGVVSERSDAAISSEAFEVAYVGAISQLKSTGTIDVDAIKLVDEYGAEARRALATFETREARLNLTYIDAMRAVFQLLVDVRVG